MLEKESKRIYKNLNFENDKLLLPHDINSLITRKVHLIDKLPAINLTIDKILSLRRLLSRFELNEQMICKWFKWDLTTLWRLTWHLVSMKTIIELLQLRIGIETAIRSDLGLSSIQQTEDFVDNRESIGLIKLSISLLPLFNLQPNEFHLNEQNDINCLRVATHHSKPSIWINFVSGVVDFSCLSVKNSLVQLHFWLYANVDCVGMGTLMTISFWFPSHCILMIVYKFTFESSDWLIWVRIKL